MCIFFYIFENKIESHEVCLKNLKHQTSMRKKTAQTAWNFPATVRTDCKTSGCLVKKKRINWEEESGVIGKMVEKEREAWGGPSMWRDTAFVGPTTFQLRPQCGVHHNPPFPFPTSPFSVSHRIVRTTNFDFFPSFFYIT